MGGYRSRYINYKGDYGKKHCGDGGSIRYDGPEASGPFSLVS